MPKLNRREFVAASTVMPAMLAVPAAFAAPQDARKYLLSSKCPLSKIASTLIPRAQWKPFPTVADRDAWAELLPETRATLVAAGEERLKGNWPALPATLFL